MKKIIIDILLVLLLAAAIAFLVLAVRGNDLPPDPPTAAATPTITASLLVTVVPTKFLTPTLIPASVTIPTRTRTPTPSPTLTPSRTPTVTFTPMPSATSTGGPTQSLADREIRDGIERGNQIVQAIEAYHAAVGEYPADLIALVPAYLSTIPFTSNDRPYFYRLFDPAGPLAPEVYWLAFRLDTREHVTCTYMRRLDYWDCNFDSP